MAASEQSKIKNLALYGHTAHVLTEAIAKSGMTTKELGHILAPDNKSKNWLVTPWKNGYAPVPPAYHSKLVELLQIDPSDLLPRKLVEPPPAAPKSKAKPNGKEHHLRPTGRGDGDERGISPSKALALFTGNSGSQPQKSPPPPLQFVVTADGQAHIRLDMTTTLERGQHLMRLLFETGYLHPHKG